MTDLDSDPHLLALEGNMGIPFSYGNQLTVLRNGERIFPPMLAAIRAAETTIEFLTFIYWEGDMAERFADALAERAAAGVRVRVLLDALGAKPIPRPLLDRMSAAGVDIRWFRRAMRWQIWKADNRTHRKVLVCDGIMGFTGGVGIASEWEGDARNKDEWRDTHIKVRGPAVHGLRGAFLASWAATGRPGPSPERHIPKIGPAGNTPVQVVRATGADAWNDIATLMHVAITQTTERLRICTPYFVPNERIIDLLCQTADNGTTVEILVPGPYHDKRIGQLAGEADFEPLLAAGVRIYRYQRSMMHAKVVTVDGVLAYLGSANCNQRSMQKDDELNLALIDRELVAELDADFDRDITLCQELGLEQWRKRGFWQRTMEKFAQSIRQQT